VYSHLKRIPSLRSFTAGCLSGGNFEGFSRETDGALDTEILRLGAFNELLAHLLKRGDFSAGESNANFMSFLQSHSISGDNRVKK
jgi:hypothetical protein